MEAPAANAAPFNAISRLTGRGPGVVVIGRSAYRPQGPAPREGSAKAWPGPSIGGLPVGVAIGATLQDLRGRPDLRLRASQDRVVAWPSTAGRRCLAHRPARPALWPA